MLTAAPDVELVTSYHRYLRISLSCAQNPPPHSRCHGNQCLSTGFHLCFHSRILQIYPFIYCPSFFSISCMFNISLLSILSQLPRHYFGINLPNSSIFFLFGIPTPSNQTSMTSVHASHILPLKSLHPFIVGYPPSSVPRRLSQSPRH